MEMWINWWGTIQRKTGEARESIEQFFEQFSSNGAAAIGRAVRQFADMPSRRLKPSRNPPNKLPPRCVRVMPKSRRWCGNDLPNRWRFASPPA